MTIEPTIEPARTSDVDGVLRLLDQNHLPVEGWREHLATTVVARIGKRVVGSAAIEPYPDGVLLRSVAVSPELQRSGLGRKLTMAALRLARDRQVPAVYLLTTTAQDYFRKFGFERIDRVAVPDMLQNSVEFASACPSTAIVMRKRL